MPDVFTETTHTGYGQRLKGALGGIVVGLIMFVGAFPLTWWNEGRAVRQQQSLTEGAGAVISVEHAQVDAANEGRLIHVSGRIEAEADLTDDDFGISVDALGLRRRVAMYQWVEKRESKEEKKIGGGTETVTTWRYQRDWEDEAIDSSNFKHTSGHENPGEFPVQSQRVTAQDAHLGAFAPDAGVLSELDDWQRLRTTEATEIAVPDFHATADGFYRGNDPDSPQIGDVRVRFEYVPEGVASIVAQQSGSGFAPYQTKAGNTILLVNSGAKTAAEMFAQAQRENTILTWIVRALGFALMWIGLGLVLRPLSVLLDVLPLLGSIAGLGIGLVTGVVAFFFTAVTIALAWLWYRPLLGITLLVVAGASIFLLRRDRTPAVAQAGAPAPMTAPPPPPPQVAAPPPPPPGAPR